MRTLSDSLGSHGGGIEYTTTKGDKVTIMPLTLKLMSKYEKHLESKAIEHCLALKNIDAKLFKEAFLATSQDITRGAYAFGGELAQESLQTPSGISKLVALMGNVTDDKAMELVMNEGDSFKDVLDLAIRQSLPQKEGDEGNAQETQKE
jgi:hypothetical protein